MNSRGQNILDARHHVIRAAGDLFHAQGVYSTTADEIAEAAGISKAEFHQCFKCKPELIVAVLRSYFESMAAGTGPVNYELDSWDDLEQCLAGHLEFQQKFRMTRSCPIGTLGSELKAGDELTRQSLNLILDLMMVRLGSFFSREKVAGRLSSAADVEQLANFCVATIQGAMLTGKARRNCRFVESVFEDLLRHLKRYVKVPTAPRKRRGRDRDPRQLSALPKPQEPTAVAKLHDPPNPGSSTEDHPVHPCRPNDEARIDGSNPLVDESELGVCHAPQSSPAGAPRKDFPAGSKTACAN